MRRDQPLLIIDLSKAWSEAAREAAAAARRANKGGGEEAGAKETQVAGGKGRDMALSDDNTDAFVDAGADAIIEDMQTGKQTSWQPGPDESRVFMHDADDEDYADREDVDGNPLEAGELYEDDWNDTGDIYPMDKEGLKEKVASLVRYVRSQSSSEELKKKPFTVKEVLDANE